MITSWSKNRYKRIVLLLYFYYGYRKILESDCKVYKSDDDITDLSILVKIKANKVIFMIVLILCLRSDLKSNFV